MPVRSLNSSVFKWPDRSAVDHAVRDWAEMAVNSREGIIKLGYFGSYRVEIGVSGVTWISL